MKIKCTLKQLYDYNELHNHVLDKNIKVNGRYGFKQVNTVAITAKNSEQIKITTKNKSIICSPDHLLFTDKWKKVKELTINDSIETKNGAEQIIKIEKLNTKADLYDLDVKDVHEFYANDIVSHNSAISNLVIYMLYGQIDGFTQKDIPNRINKHFEGEIFFESNRHEVHIYRALAPNDFKVEVDGNRIDTAGKSNVQKWLEDEIYKMNYQIFRNSIVLSVNDFKSFVDLSPKEKREIIDKIFGYGVINQASTKIKDKLKKVKSDINLCENNIDGYKSSLEEIGNNINEIESKNVDSSVSKFNDLKKVMREKVDKYKKLNTKIEETKTDVDYFNEKYAKHLNRENEIKTQLKLYDNGTCPTCGARLDDDEHLALKNNLLEKQKLIKSSITKLENNATLIRNAYDKAIDERDVLFTEINEMKIEYTRLDTSIKEQEKAKDQQIKTLKSMQESIETKIVPKKEELQKLNKTGKILSIVNDIFSDSGLKQYISNIYVPLINSYVSETCSKLGIPYRVVFSTGYECEITFMGEVVNYKTLSTGERKKVDIAATLAFLKIIKTKVSDINILFLDEVLSSIDVESCNELLKIFSDFSKDTQLRIYMVHHANLDSTYVDDVIAIEKQNGFSHFL